jgi:hypothetical protein
MIQYHDNVLAAENTRSERVPSHGSCITPISSRNRMAANATPVPTKGATIQTSGMPVSKNDLS